MGVAGYLFAFSPALALYLSWHTHVLHRTPLALSFVLIGTIARIFGRGPSILAPVITAVVFNYFVAVPENAWALTAQGLFETCLHVLPRSIVSTSASGPRVTLRL